MRKYIAFFLLCIMCGARAGGDPAPQANGMELGPDTQYLALEVGVKLAYDTSYVKTKLKRTYSSQAHRLYSTQDCETATLETRDGDYRATVSLNGPLLDKARISVQYELSSLPYIAFFNPKQLAANTVTLKLNATKSEKITVTCADKPLTLSLTAKLIMKNSTQ